MHRTEPETLSAGWSSARRTPPKCTWRQARARWPSRALRAGHQLFCPEFRTVAMMTTMFGESTVKQTDARQFPIVFALRAFLMPWGGKKSNFSILPPSFWYCCVDVSVSRQMLVTGDNMGKLILLGLDGKKVRGHPLHRADHFMTCTFLNSVDLLLDGADFQRQVAQKQSVPRRVQHPLRLAAGDRLHRPHG